MIVFWVLVWVMMALAFGTAWTFIVWGCESMDGEEGADDPHIHSADH